MTKRDDMTAARLVKSGGAKPLLVAVIASLGDLARATRMQRPPDLFELRLDALYDQLDEVERNLESLIAPLIVTARRPEETGMNNLAAAQRRDSFLRFLPHAAWIDMELSSAAELKTILRAADEHNVKRIISVHDLEATPGVARLTGLLRSAQGLRADIFKIATRTDTREDLARLLEFFDLHAKHMAISAMGIGRLGRKSRRELLRRGSALNYAHLGSPRSEGQLSISEMRRALRRSHDSRATAGRGRNFDISPPKADVGLSGKRVPV